MSYPRLASLALAVAVFGGALCAQDPLDDLPGLDAPIEEPGQAEPGLPTDMTGGIRVTGVRGFLESRGRIFFKDRNQGLNDEQWIQELELELEFWLTEGWTGYFRPRFLIDVFDTDLVRTEPLEVYVTWTGESGDLRVGQMIENWGIADTFNPVDVLNRRDLAEDPLDPARLGELGARGRLFFDGGDVIGEPVLSAYVIPVFRTTQFPTSESRWSLAPPPNELREDLGLEPSGFDRWFTALRFQNTLSTGPANADVQLVASRGPDKFPIIFPVPNTGGGFDLIPAYYGLVTLGGGIRAVPNAESLADYTLKAEVVHKAPYRFEDNAVVLPDDYWQYAFGVDRLFPNVFSDKDQITATIEWVGESGANDITKLFRPFQDDLVLRAFWEANDFSRTSLELRGVVDPKNGDWFAEGTYAQQLRSIHEDLKLELGLRWFDIASTEPGFFALFPNNSTVYMALRFDF